MQLKDYFDLVEFLKEIKEEKRAEKQEWQGYIDKYKEERTATSEEVLSKYSMQEHEAGRFIRLLEEGEVILK